MLKKNVGRLDRALRLLVGASLISIGLLVLRGAAGNPTGLVVAAFAVMPILTGLTGFCPAYLPFGIATAGSARDPVGRSADGSEDRPTMS